MSVRWISLVWENSKAKGTDLLVELALADWANDDGECWPSMEAIGRKARLTPRNARSRIRSLQNDLGEVDVIENGGKSSRRGGLRSNLYRLTVHMPPDTDASDPIHNDEIRMPATASGKADTDASDLQIRSAASSPIRMPATAEPSLGTVSEPSSNDAWPKKPKKKAPISEDFEVTPSMRRWCIDNGIRSNPDSERPKFVDYHRSKGTTFADPDAAFRNWLRNADTFAAGRGGQSGGPAQSRSMQAVDRVLGAIDATDTRELTA